MKSIIILLGILFSTGLSAQPPGVEFPYKECYADAISPQITAARRAEVERTLSPKAAAIVFSSDFYECSDDFSQKMPQNSNMIYLAGVYDQKAVLLISPAGIELNSGGPTRQAIFLAEQTASQIVWEGPKIQPDSARSLLGIKSAAGMGRFAPCLDSLLNRIDTLYIAQYSTYGNFDFDPAVNNPDRVKELAALRERHPNVLFKPLLPALKRLREAKDSLELALIQKAVDISIEGHIASIKAARPGIAEYELQSIMESVFRRHGAGLAYPSIVGAGRDACFLHYTCNCDTAHPHDMIRMDCGARWRGYCSDITRTIPADGTFTPEQRIIYNIVLEARDSALARCFPSNQFMAPHMAAMSVISRRLTELGILKDKGDYRWYFPHGAIHYLGLDVHDTGTYGKLREGVVLAIEPGIYIPEGSPCDKKWWNIAVHIEDDVLITRFGCKVLSAALPVAPDEIEALMKKP